MKQNLDILDFEDEPYKVGGRHMNKGLSSMIGVLMIVGNIAFMHAAYAIPIKNNPEAMEYNRNECRKNEDVIKKNFADLGVKVFDKDYHPGDELRYTKLFSATRDAKEDLVSSLIEEGVDLNKGGWVSNFIFGTRIYIFDVTPLHSAASCGLRCKGILELLIEAGAEINPKDSYGYTPLCWAARYNQKDAMDLLVKSGAKLDIHSAAVYGDVDRIEELLSSGADVNKRDMYGRTPLSYAVQHSSKNVIELLIKNGADANIKSVYEWTPLHDLFRHRTVKENNSVIREDNSVKVEIMGNLIIAGADVNAKGIDFYSLEDYGTSYCFSGLTPLHFAMGYADLEILGSLIEFGANINSKDNHGISPIRYEWGRRKEVAEFMISKGAEVDIFTAVELGRDDLIRKAIASGQGINDREYHWDTPLHISARKGYKDIATLLIELGADIEAMDELSTTPLMAACIVRDMEMVELFVERGADVNHGSGERTPLSIAVRNKHDEIADFLRQNGAIE